MENREHWASRIGFLLAAIGSTVGLGLLWKFPYVIGQNGGGLFLIAYFVCIFLIGIPLFIGEIVLGKSSQCAAIGSFEALSPNKNFWKIGGYLGVSASFLIMSFYSVIAGWGMSYILMSLTGFYNGRTHQEIFEIFQKLSSSGSISLLWHFIFTAITMTIVMSGVRKGIEHWSKIMVKILLITLFALFLYSVTLPGFSKAAAFVFFPDTKAFTMSSLLDALGLAFMTMSIGQGIMISYGSYLSGKENLIKLSCIVAGSVMIVAILASLTIFPIIFTFDLPLNSGPGLVFQTLPYLFAKLPGAMIISTLFFILFVFTALTSAVPLVEVVTTNIMERYKTGRKKTAMLVSLSTFIFGIPSALAYSSTLFPQWKSIFRTNFFDTINDFVSIWIIPLAGLFTSLFIGYVVEKKIIRNEIVSNNSTAIIWHVWRFFIRYIVPIFIILIFLQGVGIIHL